MHPSNRQVVEVVMRQHYPTDEDGNDPAQVIVLCCNVAEDAEEIGDHNLRDLTFNEEPELPEHEGANDGCVTIGLPESTPMRTEKMMVCRKLPMIYDMNSLKGILPCSAILSNIPPTTLNRMIATASFTIPSPKMIENILGNYDALMRVNAATESVADMVALYLTIRAV